MTKSQKAARLEVGVIAKRLRFLVKKANPSLLPVKQHARLLRLLKRAAKLAPEPIAVQ
jgi:hypothetical protein